MKSGWDVGFVKPSTVGIVDGQILACFFEFFITAGLQTQSKDIIHIEIFEVDREVRK